MPRWSVAYHRVVFVAASIDASLARLRIECIDLYQIHWPQRNVPMFGATEFDPAKEKSGPPIEAQIEGNYLPGPAAARGGGAAQP